MPIQVHPSAIVSKKAGIADGVSIGPSTVVGDNVTILENTRIGAHCLIDGYTTIGPSCTVFTGAVIGSQPQDLKYKGEKSYLEIGERNIIREYCTFNTGTGEGGRTVVGSGNLFMAYSHVAHDCIVGNDCVIANNGTLAGHVTIEDKAVVGGLVAIHQFVRVGTLSIIGGCSKVVQDIPPYSTCDGHPARIYGLNLVGLRRSDTSRESIALLNRAFKILFNSGLSIRHALKDVQADKELCACAQVRYLLEFVQKSERGIAHSCRLDT